MVKILKKCAAVACYLFLMSLFFEFQIKKLFDVKQFLIWLLGTGLFLLPSLGEKTEKETWSQRLQRISQCGLWASFLESFLLCLAAMEQMKGTEELLSEIALCLRPVLYGVCIWTVFVEPERKYDRAESEKGGSFKEITVSESYALFEKMGLTKRECEIAILICQGMSNGEIAENLCISEATVKKHVSNIFEKLGCSKREQIRMKLFSQ
ncbi:MAG: response regulator transcription factor [Lachnospiraceae bacterium]|nr:response regulator transcription factor [Lachnospiraceae bacterium]